MPAGMLATRRSSHVEASTEMLAELSSHRPSRAVEGALVCSVTTRLSCSTCTEGLVRAIGAAWQRRHRGRQPPSALLQRDPEPILAAGSAVLELTNVQPLSLGVCVQFGQLGNGTTEDASTPVPCSSVTQGQFRQLACGWRHSMAVTMGGDVYSWGRGVSGQLGHGDSADWCAVSCLRFVTVVSAGKTQGRC